MSYKTYKIFISLRHIHFTILNIARDLYAHTFLMKEYNIGQGLVVSITLKEVSVTEVLLW